MRTLGVEEEFLLVTPEGRPQPVATTVLRQGFRRGDRVLRTAMVAVTDPESPAAPPPAADEPATD